MGIDTYCPLCQQAVETIIHALCDCTVVKPIWHQLNAEAFYSFFFKSELLEWLEKNGRENIVIPQSPIPWRYTFLFAIWVIWLKRNHSAAAEIRHRTLEFYLYGLGPRNSPKLIKKHIRWERPIQGWMKLNTDGSSLGNPRIARGGGVVRDEYANWIVGFSRKIGRTTSYVAEL